MKVEYINHMGDDLMVVNAARVSFDKRSVLEEGKLADRDRKLIGYLARNAHWTPFAHPQICLRITVPIFIANQLKRHVVGLVVNEVSRRYVDDPPTFFEPGNWRYRPDKSIKQGSGLPCNLHDQLLAQQIYNTVTEFAADAYRDIIQMGIAPEMARMVLPQSMYTSWYWTGSLAAYARICKQRLDAHAQEEIQTVAGMINNIIRPLFPVSWPVLLGEENEGTANTVQ